MPATLVDAAELYEVLRPFTGPDSREMARGEIVDCSTWRNVQPLINTRYLAPIRAHPRFEELKNASNQSGGSRGPGRGRKEGA